MIICWKYELLQILYCCCCHPAVSILTAAAACTAKSHFLGAAVAFVERLAARICIAGAALRLIWLLTQASGHQVNHIQLTMA